MRDDRKERAGAYREGKVEDFLDEVGGGNGTENSLDTVLLLLHVGLFVELEGRAPQTNVELFGQSN